MVNFHAFGVCFAPIAGLVAMVTGAAPAYAGRLEAGQFNTVSTTGGSPGPTSVSFQQTFDVPPVVVGLSDQQGGDSASIRITNITTTGFQALIIEPDNHDGPHVAQNVHYIAVEPGRHVLPGGQRIEAGRTSVSTVQFGPGVAGTLGWTNVTLSQPLFASAAVISQIQTANSETRNVPSQSSRPHITAIATSPTTTSFQLSLERSQAAIGTPVAETIGWIAFPSGQTGSFRDVSNTAINWGASVTVTNIRGWQNGCFTNPQPVTGGSVISVAKKITRNNRDGGWLRSCSRTATQLGLSVDEDTDQDNERRVPGGQRESAAIIAFSQSFHANLRPVMGVTKVNTGVSTVTPATSGFYLPGGIVDYEVVVTNSGNAPTNYTGFEVIEVIPPGLDIVLTDYGAASSGPIEFTDGTPGSGMGYSYVSLNDTGDSLSFSSDGVNFNHPAVPNGDGVDPTITHVRVIPSGFFANSDTETPSFRLRFRGRVE